MVDALDADAFDDLRTDLAAVAAERIDEDTPAEEALWEAVGGVVPELTRPVSDSIVEHSAFSPIEPLVEEVVTQRESDDDERRRAEAITVLLCELDDRLAEDGYDPVGFA